MRRNSDCNTKADGLFRFPARFTYRQITKAVIMTREEKAARNAIIAERRRANASISDIAAEFGLTYGAVSAICKSLGLGGKRSIKVATYRPPTFTKAQLDAKEERRRNVVAERCPGFTYVGNYTGSDGTADVQCNICGAILTKSWITIKHAGGKNENIRCDNCERIAREQREQARETERARVNVQRQFVHNARELNRQAQLMMRKCSGCESIFFTSSTRQKFCSFECQQRNKNRKCKDKRLRKIRERCIDSDITWQKLYEKEHGICYLCGKPVDINDYEYRGEIFIAGNNYPSIEHVVALSKGGTHSWDNVRLAHRLCNTLKH